MAGARFINRRDDDLPSLDQAREYRMHMILAQQRKRTDAEGGRLKKALEQMANPYSSELYLEDDLIHPLIRKVAGGDTEGVRALLQNDVDVNVRGGEWRETPLIVACKTKSVDMVEILLSYKADVNSPTRRGETPLILAIANGSEEIVDQLLDCGANVHLTAYSRLSALHIASSGGRLSIVSKLIARGADVNCCDVKQVTPLMLCKHHKFPDTTELLIKHGADIDARESHGVSALGIAALNGYERLEALIKAKANVNQEDKSGGTPLMYASKSGFLHVVKELVEHGANVNHCDKRGVTALRIACSKEHEDIVKYLLSAGVIADPNICDNENFTPLMCACGTGNSLIIQLLLETGADPLVINNDGMTALNIAVQNDNTRVVCMLLQNHQQYFSRRLVQPQNKEPLLHIACVSKNIEQMRLLLHCGAEIERRDKDGRTPLMVSASTGNDDVVYELLKAGAKVDASDWEGNTPLMVAAQSRNLKVIEVLLQAGADVNRCDMEGRTTLMMAAKLTEASIIELLLSKDPNINVQDYYGWTALMVTAEHGHIQAAQRLIEAGADVTVKLEDGETALHISSRLGYNDLAELLLQAEVSLDKPEEDLGWTPLHCAASKGLGKLAKHLIKKAAVVDAVDSKGMTPLMLSCECGHDDLLQILIDNGADLNHTSSNGQTAVHLAIAGGHYKVLGKLVNRRARLDCVDKEKRTPLIMAALRGSVRMMSLVLRSDLDIDRPDSDERTPLALCSQFGYTECMSKLLQQGASADLKDKNECTALHIASEKGHAKAVKLLLSRGAEVNLQDRNGLTPLMITSNNNLLDIATFLLDNTENKCLLSCQDHTYGNTALHIAAERGNSEIARLLVDKGSSVNATNKRGRSALHICGIHGHGQIVKILLEHNADLDLTDEDGNTAQALSAQYKQYDVAEMMIKTEQRSKGAEESCLKGAMPLEEKEGHHHSDTVATAKVSQQMSQSLSATGMVTSPDMESEGALEFEVLGEGDIEKEASLASKKCEKYPGHKDFIPLPEFTLQHLPERFQSEEVLGYIKASADLTVRISVKISLDRPKDDPFSKLAGSRITGSAWVFSVGQHNEDCHCKDCESHGYKNRKWWRIYLCSSTHCIADDYEAENARVDFFYDSDEPETSEKMKSLYGIRMASAFNKADICDMTCATHDDDLGKYLQQRCEQVHKVRARPLSRPANLTSTSDRQVLVCISHPHGSPKQVTIGDLVRQRDMPSKTPEHVATRQITKDLVGISDQLADYETPTCKGSSGSIVICLDHVTSGDASERIFPSGTHLRGRSKGLNIGYRTKVLSLQRFLEYERQDVAAIVKTRNREAKKVEKWWDY